MVTDEKWWSLSLQEIVESDSQDPEPSKPWNLLAAPDQVWVCTDSGPTECKTPQDEDVIMSHKWNTSAAQEKLRNMPELESPSCHKGF